MHILLKMHNEVMLTFSKDHHKVIDVGVKPDSPKYQPVLLRMYIFLYILPTKFDSNMSDN